MSQISASTGKALREKTDAPFKECKAALVEAEGDMDKALTILRERNLALRGKKAEKEATEGRIGVYIDEGKQVGGIVEMRCQTAPSANNELFIALTNELAEQVAAHGASSVDELVKEKTLKDDSKTIDDRITEVVGLIRENMKPERCAQLKGTLGSYTHHDGTVGVLLQVEGEVKDPQVLRDVCMHIAARSPLAARREDIPQETIDKEMEIAKKQAESTGKPANIVERIAEGKMKSWFAESVLADQPFVKDESITVEKYLQNAGLKLVTFIRYKVGEVAE